MRSLYGVCNSIYTSAKSLDELVIVIIKIITRQDTACCPGAAADKAADNKSSKYCDLAGTHLFSPVAIKTAGTWNQMAVELVQQIGRRITLVTEDSQDSIFVPVPVHCPSTGKCGLLPQHVHCQRLITHCSHFLLNFQSPTGYVLAG